MTIIRVLLITLRIAPTESKNHTYPLSLSTSSIARRTCVGPGEAKMLPHTAAYTIKRQRQREEANRDDVAITRQHAITLVDRVSKPRSVSV